MYLVSIVFHIAIIESARKFDLAEKSLVCIVIACAS